MPKNRILEVIELRCSLVLDVLVWAIVPKTTFNQKDNSSERGIKTGVNVLFRACQRRKSKCIWTDRFEKVKRKRRSCARRALSPGTLMSRFCRALFRARSYPPRSRVCQEKIALPKGRSASHGRLSGRVPGRREGF